MDTTLKLVASLLVNALVYGTALTALAWLVTRVCRAHLAPGAVATLWLLVLAKFLLPIGPPLPSGLSSALREGAPLAAVELLAAVPSATGEVSTSGWSLANALAVLWLVAACALALRAVSAALALRRTLHTLPSADAALRERVARHARTLGVAVPSVRVGGEAPFVVGLFRPWLVLPPQRTGDALDAIIVHELGHLARRDHWTRAVQVLVQVLFFFWPPLRFAQRRLDEAREQACDALVLEHVPIRPHDYAQLLLDLQRQVQDAPASALAMAANVSQLEGRIDMLIEPTKRRAGALAAVVVVGFSLVAVALGAHAAEGAASQVTAEERLKAATNKVMANDLKGAVQDLEACVALAPAAPLLGTCYKNLGIIQTRAGNKELAARAFRSYLPLCTAEEAGKIKALIARLEKK